MAKLKVFISSVQSEFSVERRMLADYLSMDALFRKYFSVFIFEDLPAQDRKADDLYLEEVKNCDVFIGLLGKDFGFEFKDGTSPTEREFDCATAHNKYRLIFLTNAKSADRHQGVNRLIGKISDNVVYGKFSSPSELLSDVYTSMINYLISIGKIRVEPFDKTINTEASLQDISEEKVRWFVEKARAERAFPVTVNASIEKVLTHLNLCQGKSISNAAILLFGKQPQRFFNSSEIKCAHFHGTKVEKPIPFYQVYKGNIFDLIDQSVNFVLSKIDYAVGSRKSGPQAPTAYEIPPEVIEEAIVNAIAHRDYDSNGSVQVMLFADRLEIRNPGSLPPALSLDKLTKDHSSFPFNPLIAEALYLTKYIERMGTGIQDMITRCAEAGLPAPSFKMEDTFVVVIKRKEYAAFEQVGGAIGGQTGGQITPQQEKDVTDNVTDNVTDKRWELILQLIKANNNISTSEIAKKTNVTKRTVLRDIELLKQKGVLSRIGPAKGGHWVVISN